MPDFKTFIVNRSVVDLRREPQEHVGFYEKDPLQESQLLYGESVKGFSENNLWVFVEAVEQQRYTEKDGWTGYPGWIKKSDLIEVKSFRNNNATAIKPWVNIYADCHSSKLLDSVSFGTRFQTFEQQGEWYSVLLPNGSLGAVKGEDLQLVSIAFSEAERRHILSLAESFIGYPYLWGGCSAFRGQKQERPLTSCDCSGFVNLLYRSHGIALPRDAHDQFLRCDKKEHADLKEADLIFLASADKPARISHVMLYAGGDVFIDANITDRKIVKSTGLERFGCALNSLHCGESFGKYVFYFGALQL
jgi:hypothetical protein